MFKEIFTESINEASVSDKWALILKNIKNIKKTNYSVNNGKLDLAWYGSCYGCINNSTTQKGILYNIKGEDWSFTTNFTDSKALKVRYYNADNDAYDYDLIPFNTLTKQMKKVKAWSGTPIQINDEKTSKYSHFAKSTKWKDNYDFVFADGQVISVDVDKNDEPTVRRASIENKIAQIEEWGYKIARKVKPDLERFFPELYGSNAGFTLDNNIWLQASKISKDKDFLSFINSMDNESRTGHGVKLDRQGVSVHGMIGNTSSGFRSKEFTWKIAPKSFAEFNKFIKSSGALKYIIELQQAMHKSDSAYRNYMSNGGAMD